MQPYDSVKQPTLILDPQRVRANVAAMAAKAAAQGVRFRPHFKTHQSAQVGEWFRAYGVDAITVSSLSMAEYFALNGWDDITIAFSLNLRELPEIASLARRVKLGLLVESPGGLAALEGAGVPADVWIKVDAGSGRTGLPWDDPRAYLPLLARGDGRLRLRGLLAHAGETYRARGPEEVVRRYQQSVERMLRLRQALSARAGVHLEISVGDTPGCALSPEFGPVEEVRPGNFVFFDAQQYYLGACHVDQIAVVAACPVVACHPRRGEVVVYGGAVHLSKDTVRVGEQLAYGLVCLPQQAGWGEPITGAWVDRLSQEHGILKMPPDAIAGLREGDVVYVVPAHVCLAVSAMGSYRTTGGEVIDTIHSCAG